MNQRSDSIQAQRARSPSQRSFIAEHDSEPTGTLRIAGRVVSQNGQPVADADVTLIRFLGAPLRATRMGFFFFDSLLSRSYEIRARAGELIGGPHVFRPTGSSAPVVTLREGSRVFVTVVDAKNGPLPGAEIRVAGDEAVIFIGENGEATIATHPGWVKLEAMAENRAPRRVSIALGSTARVRIVLHKGFPIVGRVLDEDRRPIPNARIYALQSRAACAARIKTSRAPPVSTTS